jgi:hypothetical protein
MVRVTRALCNLAVLAFVDASWEVILERSQAAFQASLQADDPTGRGHALIMIGEAQLALGDPVGGARAIEEALSLLEIEGPGRLVQDACFSLAHAWVLAGMPDRAESFLRRSAGLVRDLEAWTRLGDHFIGLAEVRAAQDRHRDALTFVAAAEAVHENRPWQVDRPQRELADAIRVSSTRVVGAEEAERCAAAGRLLAPEEVLGMLGAPLSAP